MKLQIEKLFLVRRGTKEVKSFEFETGKLNIIMGQGARGKSTIWDIIDYVCGAKECEIDSKIVAAVEWVGAVFETSSGRYVIAREVMNDTRQASKNYYKTHVEAGEYELNGLEIVANAKGTDVSALLDRVTGIEAMKQGESGENETLSFSIRYLLCIVGQSYSVVADQTNLVANKSPQTLQTIAKFFPSIIGVDADELNRLNALRMKTKKELTKKENEYKDALKISEKWKNDLIDQLTTAKGLTMIAASTEIPKETPKALEMVRSILEEAERNPRRTYDVKALGDLADRVAELEGKKIKLETEIMEIKFRIEELELFLKQAKAVRDEAAKVKDRLEIGDWMIKNWGEYQPGLFRYPYSDGKIADEVRTELKRLAERLKMYEQTALSQEKILKFTQASKAEKHKLEDRLEQIKDNIDAINREIDGIKAEKAENEERITKYQEVNRRADQLVGELRKTLELVDALAKSGELSAEIGGIKQRLELVESDIRLETVRVDDRIKKNLDDMCARAYEIAKGIKLDDSFTFAHVSFDRTRLDFDIQEADKVTHFKNRKSSGNHISFHIGFTAALEEMCSKNEKALLPDFVVYDQPSQGRSGNTDEGNVGEVCFINIAKELAKSVTKSGGSWQPILIDSWGNDTLGKLQGVDFKLVADLDATSGLVPLDWMNGK